jgi:hypothetical protein
MKEYFVRGTEQICRTVSLVGVRVCTTSPGFMQETGRPPVEPDCRIRTTPRSSSPRSATADLGPACCPAGIPSSPLCPCSLACGPPNSVFQVSKSGRWRANKLAPCEQHHISRKLPSLESSHLPSEAGLQALLPPEVYDVTSLATMPQPKPETDAPHHRSSGAACKKNARRIPIAHDPMLGRELLRGEIPQ